MNINSKYLFNETMFSNLFYNIIIFNITNQQRRIKIMQLLVPFDHLHVAVGITHFKLSTTFSEICSISYKQNELNQNSIISANTKNHFKKKKRVVESFYFKSILFNCIVNVRITYITRHGDCSNA